MLSLRQAAWKDEEAALTSLLKGDEWSVIADYGTPIDAQLTTGGQRICFERFVPGATHIYRSGVERRVRLFAFREYYLLSRAEAVVARRGFVLADVWTCVATCNELPALQHHFPVPALGTVADTFDPTTGRRDCPGVLCCRSSAFLPLSRGKAPVGQITRDAVTLPVQFGFPKEFLVLVMRRS